MYGGPLFVSRRCSDAGSDETNIVPTLSLFWLWLLNGLLVLAYLAADHLLVLLLLPVLIWLVGNAPAEQRPRQILIGGLALITALLAPPPIPLLLLAMAVAGAAALPFEHFNRPALRWTIARGLGLYSLIGLAFLIYQTWLAGQPAGGDTLLERGQTYVSALAGIAVYAFPLGFLGYLAQKVWLHPPTAREPGDLITGVRTRRWRS